MIGKLDQLAEVLKSRPACRIAVAGSQEAEVLDALNMAYTKGYINPILIGDKDQTAQAAYEANVNIMGWELIDHPDLKETADIAARLVSEGKADCIMKGLADTSLVLKAVLNKDIGLRTSRPLSHVSIFEVSSYSKLLFISDSAMIVAPTLEDKIAIISNAWDVAKAIGYRDLKIACVSISEKVNEKVASTIEAKILQQKYENGEFEDGLLIEGPMGLDLAVSQKSADIKSYTGKIRGDADMILCPSLEMGNAMAKSITYFAGAYYAGVIMGAKVPIILTSRADEAKSKYLSILLGSAVAQSNGGTYE